MRVDNPTITPEDLLSHAAWLQRLAARLVESTAAAEDLVQDTFVAALRSPPEADRPPRPWLAQVLRNLVRNRARGSGRWAARVHRVAAESSATLPTAEELLTQHEARRLVAELVSRLEEPYRSTVLLCYGQGLSPSDVASKQEIPAGTVRWRLKKGLDDLRAGLDDRYGGDRRAWAVALGPLAAGAAGLGAAVPISGGIKVALAVVAAAAVGLWLWTWSATRPAQPEQTAAAEQRAVEWAAAGAVRPGGRRAAVGGGPNRGGPGRGSEALLAAAAPGGPGAAAGSDRAAPAGPPAEVIQKVMRVGNAPTKGDPKAPVTIVAFSEFQCPFCARTQPVLKELLALYPKQVRLVFKNLPLPFHEHAKLAAEAALAAQEQGKFWEMHDRLFANQKALAYPDLEVHAQAIGLDLARFRKALDEKRFLPAVEEDMRLAKEADINGAPSFYINGVAFVGAQPVTAFKQAVEDALARGKGEAPAQRPSLPAEPPAPSPEALARAVAPGDAPSKGDPKALVTMVVFSDFECPFCAKLAPLLNELLVAYPKDLRIVYKNLPLPFHLNAQLAAEAALAANEQGKFWAMHDRLFANQKALGAAALEEHAAAVGLDLGRFRKTMEERRFRRTVEEDARTANAAGLNGTPSALVNGQRVIGARPMEDLRAAVDRALARARGLPVPPEPVVARPGTRLPSGRPDVPMLDWPPPRVALPDELLGERLRVPFPTGDAPSFGPAKAAVEVLYFNDYDCMGCGRGKPLVDGLKATYGKNLRLIARPVPGRQQPGGGQANNSELVAEAAWAAHAQGKFWEMHDKLFAEQADRNRATLERYAAEIGMDVDDFRTALDGGVSGER
jgi:RNA polymerase sigma factor (sigma-70 family)